MKIISIEVDGDDVTFWFDDSAEPWSTREFKEAKVELQLRLIEVAIMLFNMLYENAKSEK